MKGSLGALLRASVVLCGLNQSVHAASPVQPSHAMPVDPSAPSAQIVQVARVVPPKLYVYRWSPPSGPANIVQFENMLGRKVDGAIDFDPYLGTADAAATIADQNLSLWRGHVRDIMYSVGLAFYDVSVAQVAAGAADAIYTRIGRSLVARGFPRAKVRLGWEMNGGWYYWGQQDSPTFQAAFTHASKVIKAACPGCTIIFDPVAGIDPSPYMPANAAGVDAIGFDDYINSWNSGGATAEPDIFANNNAGSWGFASGYPRGGRGWYTNLPGGAYVPEFGVGSRGDGHGACTDTSWNGCDDAYGMAQALQAFIKGGVTAIGVWDVDAGDYNSQVSTGERPGEALELLKVYGGGSLPRLLAGSSIYTGTAYAPKPPSGEYQLLVRLANGHVAQLVWGAKPGQSVTATDMTAAATPERGAPFAVSSIQRSAETRRR